MKTIVYMFPLLFLAACYSKDAEVTLHKGEAIPEFTLFLADSSTYFKTSTISTGKPVVLFFFGARCPYSRAQMKMFIDEMAVFKDVQLVAFTTSPFAEMKWFYKNYKLDDYPNITTGVDYTNFFWKYFKTTGVPFIAIYGRDGKLKKTFPGQTPVKQIKKIIES